MPNRESGFLAIKQKSRLSLYFGMAAMLPLIVNLVRGKQITRNVMLTNSMQCMSIYSANRTVLKLRLRLGRGKRCRSLPEIGDFHVRIVTEAKLTASFKNLCENV